MDIIIRQEFEKDYDKVYSIVKSAFENAEYTNHDEQNLVVRLRKSDAFIPELSLVADQDGELVGHIMFSKIKVDKHIALTLAPLSVLPKVQRQGIGGKLIERGHEIAKGLGFTLCVLLGHPGYYPRFGYIPASRFGIKARFDVPDDAFMAKKLTENIDISGTVEYPNEFFANE
jgi:predicted N-acetyltransferase YhbS